MLGWKNILTMLTFEFLESGWLFGSVALLQKSSFFFGDFLEVVSPRTTTYSDDMFNVKIIAPCVLANRKWKCLVSLFVHTHNMYGTIVDCCKISFVFVMLVVVLVNVFSTSCVLSTRRNNLLLLLFFGQYGVGGTPKFGMVCFKRFNSWWISLWIICMNGVRLG